MGRWLTSMWIFPKLHVGRNEEWLSFLDELYHHAGAWWKYFLSMFRFCKLCFCYAVKQPWETSLHFAGSFCWYNSIPEVMSAVESSSLESFWCGLNSFSQAKTGIHIRWQHGQSALRAGSEHIEAFLRELLHYSEEAQPMLVILHPVWLILVFA